MQAAFRNGLRQPYRIAPRSLQMRLARRMAATVPHVGTRVYYDVSMSDG